ncbi:hypothetical protein OHC33_002237 [Knufia fluminis]|uniref:BTB domain-containing protein n=1 Tax=Knufia fluminis TaxID=191047 RepID=A0AAN8I810_9EURO|nr:hypothetical protein OHC33_002237 [Knufia fluminis]
MSYNLWKYFFDDDVDSFRQYLARATFDRNASKAVGGGHTTALRVGSPGHLATSPKTPVRPKKSGAHVALSGGKNAPILTRSDINARDGFGRTLLHHAVSSRSEHAIEFVKLLLELPLLDLYVQDTESGWTALHRALYSGNVAAAQALTVKDIQNATDYTTNVSHANAGGLVKIKDHEGNSPFEVFGLTTAPRDLQQQNANASLEAAEAASVQSADMDNDTAGKPRDTLRPRTDLHGDEVFAFGSNKNITLGLGDGDDRTYPERIHLERPEHLLERLFEDYKIWRQKESVNDDLDDGIAELQELPTIIKNKPIVIQDVVMSKLHTAILTDDPISNLHICGFGPGGRLGTGDEATRFTFACIQGGGLAKRRVSSIALGQDHSIAICSSGEVFTWGSNRYGQLGYELPEVPAHEMPMQVTPRQIYGLIKKEQVIGAAASSLHSVIYTSSGIYTFGKNEGQLGLMDADARSLETQILPRRVGVSILQYAVESVGAIDRATTVLLENHDVIVFTHYGWTKVLFPLDTFGSSIASDAFFARHKRQTKHICSITSGGNTICALTSYGEVFTIDVPRHAESVPSSKSTTNPSKARNALPTPFKVWSIRKSHMAALDVAVGQDGSVILCTAGGTVWKKEKRANIKSVHTGVGHVKSKDYKFVRVPNIFGAIAVRSNSFGAFTAIRKDCDVMKEQIVVEPPTLWNNMFDLLAFREYGEATDDENAEEPQLRFWKPAMKGACPALIKRALLMNTNAEDDFVHVARRFEPLSNSDYDVWITSNVTDVRLPVHSLVLKARSKILRRALAEFAETYYFSVTDVLSVEYGTDGQIQLQLQGADFLTVVNFVLYLYTDTLADVWRFTSKALHLAPRYRAVRTELMKIALSLDMRHLERAVRVMDEPVRSLRDDSESAFHDSDLFSDADVVVDLAEGEERYAHSVILQSRCPFFEGLFQGHTGGMWMADRRNNGSEGHEAVRVDLKHVDATVFEMVLRHVYADTAEELFDAIISENLDEFIDLVIEVMAVANELMLDRLARICQKVIGRYVTPWNICGLLNTIAESSEVEFKQAGLEYIGLNLENMLEQRLLEELDEYLLEELNEMVQSNQLAFMPIARSDRALEVLLEQDPALAEQLAVSTQRRVDAMRLPSRYVVEAVRPSSAWRTTSEKKNSAANESSSGKRGLMNAATASPSASPDIRPSTILDELQFDMDDDETTRAKPRISPDMSPSLTPNADRSARPSLTRLSSSQQSYPEEDLEASSFATTPRISSIPSKPTASAGKRTASGTIWAAPSTTSPGLGLKDIMLQDSSQKVSNLTQSLQNAALSSKQAAAKISQKERKRQQHEQKLQTQAQLVAEAEQRAKEADKAKFGSPSSPWQKMTSKSATTPTRPALEQAATLPTAPSPQAQSAAPSKDSRKASQKGKDKQPQASRSVSSPGMTGASTAPPPQIQSIRHTPVPARSSSWLDARTSMADILAQQQYEKISVKETAAKRSLEEIQQEQVFQEWWDNETRRVQEEEEAAASATASRRSKSAGRGRGGKQRKGSERGSAKPSQDPVSKSSSAHEGNKHEHARVDSSTPHRGRENKSRGSYRGRGRGRGAANSQQA